MSEWRERLRTIADTYAPDRPDRSVLGDYVVAVWALLHIVAVYGIRAIVYILTGKGPRPDA
jgi:hypothetical protein